jgi:hypothetical protein
MGRPFIGNNVTELNETNVELRRRIFKESSRIMKSNQEEEKKTKVKVDEKKLIEEARNAMDQEPSTATEQ